MHLVTEQRARGRREGRPEREWIPAAHPSGSYRRFVVRRGQPVPHRHFYESVSIGPPHATAAAAKDCWPTALPWTPILITKGAANPRTGAAQVAMASEPDRNNTQPPELFDSRTSGASAGNPAFFRHSATLHNRVAATSKGSECS